MAPKRDNKGRFIKGSKKDNPGRPKGAKNKLNTTIKAAFDAVESERGLSLLQHCIEEAFTNDKLAIALLKKRYADKKSTDIVATIVADVNTTYEMPDELLTGLPKLDD